MNFQKSLIIFLSHTSNLEPFFNRIPILFSQVRREKISERMKLLQDLVPGCNKVFLKTNTKPEKEAEK